MIKVIKGEGVSSGKAKGLIKVIKNRKDFSDVSGSYIIVAHRLNPELSLALLNAKGIITERGALCSHAATISREFGIPCVINVPNARDIFKIGDLIEIDGKTGQIKIINKAYKKNFYFNLTNKCNNDCSFCLSRLIPKKNPEQTIKEIKKINVDKPIINFIGGEPTLLKERLLDIIKAVIKEKPKAKIKLISNGRLFSYNNFCKLFKGINNFVIIIKFYSENRKLHNQITKTESYKQTIQGIKNIIEHEFNIDLRIILNKQNLNNLTKTIEYLCQNFKKKISIYLPSSNKYDTKNKIEFIQIKKELSDSFDICKKSHVHLELINIAPCLVDSKMRNNINFSEIDSFIKPKKCLSCKFSNQCKGILKSYYSKKKFFNPIK